MTTSSLVSTWPERDLMTQKPLAKREALPEQIVRQLTRTREVFMKHDGGCLCGAIRFTSDADPVDAGYCHCELCRRSTGAPVLAWVSYPADAFTYLSGTPARYASSDHGHREFCSRCGTQIAYRDSRDTATVEVNAGSLDDCAWVVPRYHLWYRSRFRWFDTADRLPRFATSRDAAVELEPGTPP